MIFRFTSAIGLLSSWENNGFSSKARKDLWSVGKHIARWSSNTEPVHHINPTPSASQSSVLSLIPNSESEVSHLLHSLPNRYCKLDSIPSSLLKECASVLLVITNIINCYLSLLVTSPPPLSTVL